MSGNVETKPEPSRIADRKERISELIRLILPVMRAARQKYSDVGQAEEIARAIFPIITAIEADKASLFGAIQHGDDEHKAWLKQAIADHFAGKAVEPPRGKGNKEARIADLEADRDRMREALEKIACWGVRFPEESQGYGVHALMTAREACPEPDALKSSKPGEG